MNIAKKLILGTVAAGIAFSGSEERDQCFIYRDDIGAFWGIKGYEEQVTEVGTHHGHLSWPQFRAWGTFDSGSVRRGNSAFHSFLSRKDYILLVKSFRLPSIH